MSIYKLIEENYDNVDINFHNSYDATKQFSKEIEMFIKKVSKKGHILNVGSSLAECEHFLRHGFEVSNIDISQNILKSISQNNKEVKLIKGNVKDLSEKGLDGIWACCSLFHILPTDIDQTIVRLHDALNPGGVFCALIFTTDEDEPMEMTVKDKNSMLDGRPTTYYRATYPEALFLQKLKDAGFSIANSYLTQDQDGDDTLFILATAKIR